jgi:hypothetical protein
VAVSRQAKGIEEVNNLIGGNSPRCGGMPNPGSGVRRIAGINTRRCGTPVWQKGIAPSHRPMLSLKSTSGSKTER